MKYKKTFRVLAICLVCELYALLFASLIYSCGGDRDAKFGAAGVDAAFVGAMNVNTLNNKTIWE